jgi:pimeloyl-ACP methyl ester carboxylesterase
MLVWRVSLVLTLMCATVPSQSESAAQARDVIAKVTAPTMDAPLPRGKVVRRGLADERDLRYFIYVPRRLAGQPRMFITVHGISRNAREHAERYAPLAEEYGVVLVAPEFPAKRFPDYQRLGRANRGDRADRVLERVVAEVTRLTGARGDKVYLFGYSGGGQFVHRYAMAYPERVAGYVVGAAGWYTFPDPTLPYPRGIKPNSDLPDVSFDLAKFLVVPGAVVVGERDVHPGTALRKSEPVANQQGTTRFERGERWVASMNEQAQTRGLPAHFRFHELPRSPHSFTKSMERGDMGRWVFERLFGAGNAEMGE